MALSKEHVSLPMRKPTTRGKRPAQASAKAKRGASEQATGKAASRLIDRRVRDLGGWRGETLARMRALILAADPEATEEWKWRGAPGGAPPAGSCTGAGRTPGAKGTSPPGGRAPHPSRPFQPRLRGQTARPGASPA